MKTIMLNEDIVSAMIPKRKADTHKGDYGKLLLVCGSREYTGAPALAAMGALRSGAGLVYLAVPESIYCIEAGRLLEPVIISLTEGDHPQQLRNLIPKMDAILIGPGIGQSEMAYAMTKLILQEAKIPVVLDADGINVIAAHKDILRERAYPTILTPHDGEFARVFGRSENRLGAAGELASQTGAVVLLKGHKTIITDGTFSYINTTGNPGMATGGSGDVLSGVIVSLLGQGLAPLQAAACGAYLHGAAGDICAREIGQYGMLPQDILNALPRLLP